MQPLISHVHPLGRWLCRLLVRGLRALTPKSRQVLGRLLAAVAYSLGIRREVALQNLALAFPERSLDERHRLARAVYSNMAHAGLEALTSSGEVPLRIENWESFQRSLSLGRGVLIATAHFGSWELLGEVLARRGLVLNAVVRPLKGALNEQIVQSRLDAGMKLIPPRGAISGTIGALRRGEVVAVLLDQALPGGRGLAVPFFGRLASTSPVLSVAALRTGAPTFVAMAAREEGGLRLFLEGPIPLPEGISSDQVVERHTATLTAVIERYIRKYPEQWLWLHRRWKVSAQRARRSLV